MRTGVDGFQHLSTMPKKKGLLSIWMVANVCDDQQVLDNQGIAYTLI